MVGSRTCDAKRDKAKPKNICSQLFDVDAKNKVASKLSRGQNFDLDIETKVDAKKLASTQGCGGGQTFSIRKPCYA